MPSRRNTPPTVLVVLPSSRASRIEKLGGVYRYLSEHRLDWDLRFHHDGTGVSAEYLSCISDEYDGIIATGNLNDRVLRAVLQQPKPLVTIAIPSRRTKDFAIVETDNQAIGREAAQFLLKSGTYKCFVGIPAIGNETWSSARLNGFASAVAKHNISAKCISLTAQQCEGSKMSSLIRNLPKPAALFAACDYRANEVLRICLCEGIRVPSEVSVITVDCDPTFQDHHLPSPTYLQTNFDEQGYQAAALLNKLLHASAKYATPPQALVGTLQLTVGKSTPAVIDTGKIFERATKYIRQNLRDVRHVRDVVKYLGCSRRLIDLRFQEAGKGSILKIMTDIRLDFTAHLLKTSNRPISQVCQECGWESENHPKMLFKKRFGVSMSAWRNQCSKESELLDNVK